MKVLLAGPVLAALATAQAMTLETSEAGALAAGAMVFGLALLAPFALIATGRRQWVEPAALLLSAIVVAAVVAVGGGAASPLAVLALAPAIEAGWVARSRRAVLFGALAGVAGVAFGAAFGFFVLPSDAPAVSALQWVVPLIYAGTLFVRVPETPGPQVDEAPSLPVEEILRAAVLELGNGGDVVSASPLARNLLGVSPELLFGTGFFDRIHVADRIGYLEALADLREGADTRRLRLRVRRPAQTGSPSGGYHTVIADFASQGHDRDFILVLRDDEATADLEHELASVRHEAKEAHVARDRYLASVSHELRTPLNAIVGFSDVLANEMFGSFANEQQREYVGLIRKASGHLLSVVDTILDVSKLQSGSYHAQSQPFDLHEAVELCLAITSREAETKAVRLTAEMDADIGTVDCDRQALQQILINLLSNAVKFTPSGEVKLKARRNGDRLLLSVSDTGIGMSAEEMERVGTPFVQVHDAYNRQGTGLGLALVKGLVGLVGGDMSMESAPGAGTTVRVSLPVGEHVTGLSSREGSSRKGGFEEDESGWNHDTLRKSA